ncbi:DUF3748 domain-containing protein [Xenorhabdus bovienii]|uniref:DUF3748 domain-containing protein n=1 Tax=Xenorhabdus bovienii TaxID=40576 RepID=A0AAJ1MYN7_XENBV|nr:DUF3748 domain-containing protein [Xenorhabdus bovienii]MDE1478224.1 DUF3748 domain-containing protein [Xenorhabdus bovienii]MDE1485933.1 DUF3748 domain-containing protein [Xenorhabdus bovienii]MDE1489625.1 DUF3748 domain-containing protein [Xenorhabdus bovienii]MDE9472280.1 DUF3748 domain-containing protein [Xenorhabdus bovienii]MDE9476626.1 DUF3748 domain-containing protein [Xenorhabdus bovienii]
MVFKERQITFDSRSHQITNINIWTPDSQWLVYDVRPSGASFTGLTIEKIHVGSRQVKVIYQAQDGAHVGVVTVNPQEPVRYAFIHGPEKPDRQWQYDFHHRRGVIVSDTQPNVAVNIDALDITPPYTSGALRGGTHVHVFSPDGNRLSFTYNDHVMHERDLALDLRNVAVAIPLRTVIPPKKHPREYDGSYFSVVVSRTTAQPRSGSDEINRAYEEGWIGQRGYLKENGQWQRWALAFIGDTCAENGEKIPEIYLVDLPENNEDYAIEGKQPLAGTETTLPAPPAGVKQRRLTFTHQNRWPGVVNVPRHWLRTSPDGSKIGFLMKDEAGIVQLWYISPNGGMPVQITHSTHHIQSAFNWDRRGRFIAFVCDNSIMLCNSQNGEMHRLTARTDDAPSADAIVISPDDRYVAFMRDIDGYRQVLIVETGIAGVGE